MKSRSKTHLKSVKEKTKTRSSNVTQAEVEYLAEKLREKISEDPKKSARLLSEWIKKPSSQQKKKAG